MPGDLPDPVDILAEVGWTVESPPRQINTGWDNHLWRVEREGRPYALRLMRDGSHGDADAMSRAMKHELNAMDVAREGGFPVPAVAAEGQWHGAPFVVLEWLPGAPLFDAAKRRPWQTRKLGREFGRMQARLHTLPGDGLRPILDTDWIDRADHTGLIACIREQLAEGERRFCHFDFHPLNVLHDGDSITGLLDFPNAASSDPRADLALTNAVLTATPVPPGLARRAINTIRRRFILGWREGYLDFAGTFPLDPAFEALGYSIYYHEMANAVHDGRGWADERDLKQMRILRDEKIAAAGLA